MTFAFSCSRVASIGFGFAVVVALVPACGSSNNGSSTGGNTGFDPASGSAPGTSCGAGDDDSTCAPNAAFRCTGCMSVSGLGVNADALCELPCRLDGKGPNDCPSGQTCVYGNAIYTHGFSTSGCETLDDNGTFGYCAPTVACTITFSGGYTDSSGTPCEVFVEQTSAGIVIAASASAVPDRSTGNPPKVSFTLQATLAASTPFAATTYDGTNVSGETGNLQTSTAIDNSMSWNASATASSGVFSIAVTKVGDLQDQFYAGATGTIDATLVPAFSGASASNVQVHVAFTSIANPAAAEFGK